MISHQVDNYTNSYTNPPPINKTRVLSTVILIILANLANYKIDAIGHKTTCNYALRNMLAPLHTQQFLLEKDKTHTHTRTCHACFEALVHFPPYAHAIPIKYEMMASSVESSKTRRLRSTRYYMLQSPPPTSSMPHVRQCAPLYTPHPPPGPPIMPHINGYPEPVCPTNIILALNTCYDCILPNSTPKDTSCQYPPVLSRIPLMLQT